MVYTSVFVLTMIEPELSGDLKPYILSCLTISFFASITLIFLFKSFLRYIAFGFTSLILGSIYLYDFIQCEERSREIFYYNMLIESIFLAIGIACYFARLPECCGRDKRWLNLYCSSYIIYLVCLMNFLYELQNTMLYLVKMQEGSLTNAEQTKYIDT